MKTKLHVFQSDRMALEVLPFTGPDAVELRGGRPRAYERIDLKLLENDMIRKIENHLKEPHLRIPRISEQFEANAFGGVSQGDDIFNEQKFDIKGYNQYQKDLQFEGMSPAEQHMALLHQ